MWDCMVRLGAGLLGEKKAELLLSLTFGPHERKTAGFINKPLNNICQKFGAKYLSHTRRCLKKVLFA